MMHSLRNAVHRFRLIMVLPLSMLPFALVFLLIATPGEQGRGVRVNGGEKPWPAPIVSLTASELASFRTPPPYSGQIPVLLFHAIGFENDYYTISPKSFARVLALLDDLGYHTISISQYVAWRRGERIKLPSRPILLTFDDGEFSSYRGADQTLARYHMRATIFVIVGALQRNDPFSLRWTELRSMEQSGRWDIQFHANNGHTEVTDDARGDKGPYYAVREFRNGQRETIAQYTARVDGDISSGLDLMAGHRLGAVTMAMPFGEYGQNTAPDRVVSPFLRRILNSHFVAVFVQSGHDYTPYAGRTGPAVRYEIRHRTTLAQLYHFLYGADPAVIALQRHACVRGHFRISVYEGPICSLPVRSKSAAPSTGKRRTH